MAGFAGGEFPSSAAHFQHTESCRAKDGHAIREFGLLMASQPTPRIRLDLGFGSASNAAGCAAFDGNSC
jgi:hypothetical protein